MDELTNRNNAIKTNKNRGTQNVRICDKLYGNFVADEFLN